MRRLIVVAALMLANVRAHAESCDPSGWDLLGDILEAVGSSSSSSSSSTSRSVERGCFDRHGHMIECPPEESVPITIEIGTAVRSFAASLGNTTGSVEHDGEAFSYRATGTSAGPELAGVAQLRITAPFAQYFYAGGELEGGVFNGRGGAVEMTSSGERGTPSITPAKVAATYGVLAIAGVAGDLGPMKLGVEGAGGVRAVSYSFQSSYGACETGETHTVGMPVLEARARASVGITSHLAIGGLYGRSVIDAAWVGGVYVGWQ